MTEPPKGKRAVGVTGSGPPSAPPDRAPDRTSTIVAGTLILLTVLGVVTVFWEPLAAIAAGGSANEPTSEPRALAPDAGATSVVSPSDASGNS
jgi:hypothetical protein